MALRDDEQFVYNVIENNGGIEEVNIAFDMINEYRQTKFYARKDEMITTWEIDHKNIYELIVSIFTATLQSDDMTYQAMVGMLQHKIKLADEYARITVIADVIGLVANAGLVYLEPQERAEYLIKTDFELGELIPQTDKHKTITLQPDSITSNYSKEHGSVILGGAMNHHEGYVRLSHLNRMGQVAYALNGAFIAKYAETPKEWPTEEKKQAQWEAFEAESAAKYEELLGQENRFYLRHKYDSRGRQYACSYYINPQGASFKKAIVDLADKEIVEGF